MARSSGIVGYLLAGRQLPPVVSAALLAGLAVGGVSTIGTAERAYTVGISAGWYNAAWATAACVFGLGLARRYRRFEITTLPELFERHYSTSGRVLGVFGQLVIQVVITSLQYVAGASILNKLLPGLFTFEIGMLVTAAGTIPPARSLVLGVGVAGLQAIATARRLGAVVEGFDIRPETKEQVQSLGATFVEWEGATDDMQTEGGYAKEVSEEEEERERQLLADHIAMSDVVVTTALVPGRPAPKLISEDMVKGMRSGSVIVTRASPIQTFSVPKKRSGLTWMNRYGVPPTG